LFKIPFQRWVFRQPDVTGKRKKPTAKYKRLKEKIRNRVYEFFIESNDFNGIPLRNISEEFIIDYKESIDIIKKLVIENSISIQSSTNPHIIGFQHYPIESQLKTLEDAKDVTVTVEKFGEITSVISGNVIYGVSSTCLFKNKGERSDEIPISGYIYDGVIIEVFWHGTRNKGETGNISLQITDICLTNKRFAENIEEHNNNKNNRANDF
jgi:hypothetical protein